MATPERRLILRKKHKDVEKPSKLSISGTSDNQKRKSDFLSFDNFNPEAISSTVKVDMNSEKRIRKRRIKSTQDLNYLSSSFTSQDSEGSTKSKTTKTKKSSRVYNLPRISHLSGSPQNTLSEKRIRKRRIKSAQDLNYLSSSFTSQGSEVSTRAKTTKTKKSSRVYNLPRISHLGADFCGNPQNTLSDDELVQKKKVKKSRKLIDGQTAEDASYANKKQMAYKTKQDEVDGSDGNLDTLKFNKLQPDQIEKDSNSGEEYQSESSIISDSPSDSEEEIIIKYKRKKKKSDGSRISVDIEKEKSNTVGKYAKRIKKLLCDTLSTSSKSNSPSNLSHSSTPSLDKKCDQSPSNKSSTKQIKNEITPKADRSTNSGDNQDKSMRQSASARLSRRSNSTPHPKISSNSLKDDFAKNQKRSVATRQSNATLSENVSSKAENRNRKIKRNTRSSSILSVNVSYGMDFETDDVFNDLENKYNDQITDGNQQNPTENSMPLNSNIRTRKSVRFQSPKQNIRRETLILSKPSSLNLKPEENNDVTSSTHAFLDGDRSSSGNTKRNSTFEIVSPKLLNWMNSREDISHKLNDPLKNRNTRSENYIINASKLSVGDAAKRKSVELLSSMNKTRRTFANEKNGNSVIDLTTPVPLDNNLNAVSMQFNNQSIFYKENDESEGTVVHTVPDQVVGNNTPARKLVRTATFTKDDGTFNVSRDLPSDLRYSPLPSNSSYSHLIDTSKVNKRRRWDKSRASVSFLENSLNIGDVSAPWDNDHSEILEDSNVNLRKGGLDTKCSPKINSFSKKVSFKNDRTPSSTSTPLPKGRTNVLKQVLLKDKRDVTMNDSKNRTLPIEKPLPKIVRTKIPNFALIHQRAYDKLENIKEMSERKAARAKILLSGHKPPSENTPKMSSKRKELKFSPVVLRSASFNENMNTKRSLNKTNISVTKIDDISPSKSNLKVTNKENRLTSIGKKKEMLKAKSKVPKPKPQNMATDDKKGFTRFGFKINREGIRKVTKDEQVKAVTTKSKIVKNTLEERRGIIQGVRSNRRFELLMKMRKK